MKAIVQDVYGSPDVLRHEEVPDPAAGPGQVVVMTRATGVNAGDWHMMRGDPFLVRLMFGGPTRPKIRTVGVDVAGVVESVGIGVTSLNPGDEVIGELSAHGFGGFAERVCASESAFVPKPPSVSFPVAASMPTSGIAALQALRKTQALRPGARVLVNGASGGVGTFAVMIAKAHGAEVTAVCSGRNAEMVRSIGADHVIDYRETDPTTTGRAQEVVIDAAAFRPPRDWLKVLVKGGRYVLVGGEPSMTYRVMLLGPLWSMLGSARMEFLISKPTNEDLGLLANMLAQGSLRPIVDRTYTLEDVPAAIAHLETGRSRGKVVVVF